MITPNSPLRTVRIFGTRAEVEREVARRFVEIASNEGVHGRRINVALCGGITPRQTYQRLTSEFGRGLDWGNVHFYEGQQRLGIANRLAGDFDKAKHELLSVPGVSADQFHSMRGDVEPDVAVASFEAELDELPKSDGGLPIFDFVLLGLGRDGHIASLFPKTECMTKDSVRGWLTQVHHVDPARGERLSLTLPVLNTARHVILAVTGPDKARALQRALTSETRSVPASLIRAVNGSVEWYVDKSACSALAADRWLAAVP